MSKLLRRRGREEDLLLFNRLETLRSDRREIMEQQPTDIHHPRYAREDREDKTEGTSWEFIVPDSEPAVPNDRTIYLEPAIVAGADSEDADEAFLTSRPDPRFEVSNLIYGLKAKIDYIMGLLKREPVSDGLSKALRGLEWLSKKCDDIEKQAGMTNA